MDLKKFISYLDKNKNLRVKDIVNTIYRLSKTKKGNHLLLTPTSYSILN